MNEAPIPPGLPAGTRLLKDRCSCGHAPDHFWVRPSREWSGWSWLGIFMGVRQAPARIDYKCGRCGEVLGTLTDPEALKKLR